jgi:signal transduction histidine kinase
MGLKPTMIDELGIIATLPWMRREFHRLYPEHHIELAITLEEKEIPAELKVVIFRITQEALNNIARHSKAEWVDVILAGAENRIELTIADNGTGFDPHEDLSAEFGRGMGLTGMRERAEFTGGSFSLSSTPGEGTTIRVSWPKDHGRINHETDNR